MSPVCRLASQKDGYAELHEHCQGNANVWLKGRIGEGVPVSTSRCSCSCHGDGKVRDAEFG